MFKSTITATIRQLALAARYQMRLKLDAGCTLRLIVQSSTWLALIGIACTCRCWQPAAAAAI